MNLRGVASLAALAGLLAACGHSPAPAPTPAPTPISTAPETASPIAESPPPVRTVPDQPTEASVEPFSIGRRLHRPDYVDLQWQAYRQAAEEVGMEGLGKSAYRELLIDELLLLQAAERDPSSDDPLLQARIEMQRRRLLTDHFIEQVLWRGIEVTPVEIAAAHETQRARWTEPAQTRVRQLQFSTLEAALEAQRQLDAGESFDTVAEAMNVPVIDLGWIERGQLDRRLEDVAFRLEIGDISGVISTDAGHFLLLKAGSIPERVLPLSEVEGQIREELLQERRREAVHEFLQRQRLQEGVGREPVLIP